MKIKFLLIIAILSVSVSFSQKKWTLKECVNHALENNISVKQNILILELAELNVKNAKGNFLPNLNGSASQGFNFGSFLGIDGSRISRDSRRNSLSANSSTTLFNGFRNLNTYKQAQLGVERSKLTLEKIQKNNQLGINFLKTLL